MTEKQILERAIRMGLSQVVYNGKTYAIVKK